MLRVDGEDLQLFEYPSKAKAQEDIKTVTPEEQFNTISALWIATPHFYRTDTMIIISVGDTESIVNALDDVVGS